MRPRKRGSAQKRERRYKGKKRKKTRFLGFSGWIGVRPKIGFTFPCPSHGTPDVPVTSGAAPGTAGVPPARTRRGLQSHIIRLAVNISRQSRKALRALAGGTPAVPCWGRGTPAVPGCSLSCKSRNSRTARFSLPMNAIRHTLLYRGCRSQC